MKLFKFTFLLLLLTLLSFGDTFKEPFLWKVEKGKTSAYLFGTMHIPSPELSFLPSVVLSAIDSSDRVYTEIDMRLINQIKVDKLMFRKGGKSLDKILSKKLYMRTENYLKSISPHLSLEPFMQMKIWSLSSTLSLLKEQLKYMGLTPIDEVVFSYGEEQHKEVGGIERIEEQIGYFDKFTLDEQILMLESTLDYLEKHKEYTTEMKKLYLEGDGSKLVKFTDEQFQDKKYRKLEDKFMKILLYQRNRVMAKRIDKLLKKEPKKRAFFAFGVMHFIEKKSVIEYLKKMDYKITRVGK